VAAWHGVSDRVTFLGQVLREDVPPLLRSADVVVTVPWYEPFGIVPLEAMACGRPVIASAVGGLTDTVAPGVTGELVPPRRPDLLAAELGRLLSDEPRRVRYGRAAVVRARSRYGWNRIALETERVYGQVLRRRAAALSMAVAP
jgi:glycosyltransferase involved in cell wall biosynthesis